MKTTRLILMATAAAAATYLLLKSPGVATPPPDTLATMSSGVAAEVANSSLPSQPGWGWHYYSNGTAISPEGTYYYQNAPVAYSNVGLEEWTA